MVRPYRVTTTKISIKTVASSEEAAIQNVMNFENCPRSAIRSVKQIMSAQEAYEEDRRRCPNYSTGGPRPPWEDLNKIAQSTWEQNPTPRSFKNKQAA